MNSIRYTAGAKAIPYFCLFVSGAASLVYELIWIRQLVLIFGGTLYAISAVLCAFMIGLALGAWAIARYLNRRKREQKPLNLVRLYGVLEAGIGLYGLCFPFALNLLEGLYPLAMGGTIASGTWIHWMEFVLSTVLMLPATLLMGATLPLIGCWAIGGKADRVFADMSLLYSLNTFGAVCGCLVTQLFAVEHFGVQGTTWLAVAMNALVFFLCFYYREAKQAEETESPNAYAAKLAPESLDAQQMAPSRPLSLLLLGIFFYSGMAALASEILWTRVLVFPMGSTLYSFALILATFLFGIALGSLIAEKILGNSNRFVKFLVIELLIGIICIAILPLFDRLPEWTHAADRIFYQIENTPEKTLLLRSAFAMGLMFLPTLGFGLLFPLANRIHLNLFGTISRTLGNSYALNTAGAVLGTVLAPFVFIPLMGIRMSLFVIYAVLILLACLGLGLHARLRPARLAIPVLIGGVLVVGSYLWATPNVATGELGDHNLARTEIDTPKDAIRLLDYKEGDFATLSVIEDKRNGARTLYVNGFSTATVSDSIGGSAYMQAMGFVPMVLHPDPRKALVICFGTGNTLGAVSLFPGVSVDGVEIDRNVLSFSKWFSRWNYGVLERPNVRMVIQDGRTFTRWTDSSYDVITLEPMSPVQAGVVNLYSREFYLEARDRLNPGGLMMQWLPLHLVGPRDAQAIIKTFQEVFPHTSVWNSFLTRIVMLVGAADPVTLDKKRFDRLMMIPKIEESARRIGIHSFLDFADFYLTDGEPLQPFLQDAPVIRDDRPILEFSPVTLLPPLQWQTDESFINLLRHRAGRTPPVTGWDDGPGFEAFRRAYALRTAQRFGVFSRRYHGPGEAAFAQKKYLAGLEAVQIHLDSKPQDPILLTGARWRP